MLQVKSGYTKGKLRHFEMWWWNRDMDMDVGRKKELFKIWKQSQNEEDIKKYCKAKKMLRDHIYGYGSGSLGGSRDGSFVL